MTEYIPYIPIAASVCIAVLAIMLLNRAAEKAFLFRNALLIYGVMLFVAGAAFLSMFGQLKVVWDKQALEQALDIKETAYSGELARLRTTAKTKDQQWRDGLALVWQFDRQLHAGDKERMDIDLLRTAEPKDLAILDRCADKHKVHGPQECRQYGPGEIPAPIWIGVLGKPGPIISHLVK